MILRIVLAKMWQAKPKLFATHANDNAGQHKEVEQAIKNTSECGPTCWQSWAVRAASVVVAADLAAVELAAVVVALVEAVQLAAVVQLGHRRCHNLQLHLRSRAARHAVAAMHQLGVALCNMMGDFSLSCGLIECTADTA